MRRALVDRRRLHVTWQTTVTAAIGTMRFGGGWDRAVGFRASVPSVGRGDVVIDVWSGTLRVKWNREGLMRCR